MKKLLALLLILTLVLSCFAGCSSSSDKFESRRDNVSDSDDDDRDDDNDRDDNDDDDLDDKDDDGQVVDNLPADDEQETTKEPEETTAPVVDGVVGTYSLAFDSEMLSNLGDIDEDIAELLEIGLDFSMDITLKSDGTAVIGFDMTSGEELVDFIIHWAIEYAAYENDMTYDECMDLLIEAYGSEEEVMDMFYEQMESELQVMQEAIDEFVSEYSGMEGTYYVSGDSVFITIEGDEQEFYIEGGNLVADAGNGTSLVFKRQ